MNASKDQPSDNSADTSADKSESSTREKLLEAAKKLFAEKGFAATSVKDLAEYAQVNVSLISYHFGGKDGLYAECLEQFGRGRLRSAQNLLDTAETKEEFALRLKLFVDDFLRVHQDEPDVTQILHREMMCDDPTIKVIFERTFLKTFQQLCDFITSGMKRGYLREDLDAMLATNQFFGAMVHIARSGKKMKEYFGRNLADPEYRKYICEHQVRCFMYGISNTTDEKIK